MTLAEGFMSKEAGLADLLFGAKNKIKSAVEEGKNQAREGWKELKHQSEPTPGGSKDFWRAGISGMGRSATEGAKALPEEWHGIPVKGPARRAAHEFRKAIQRRVVKASDLPLDVQEKLKKLNVRVYEGGARSAIMRKVGPALSSYHPDVLSALVHNKPSGRIFIGGKASESPQIVRHEVGHASGFHAEHPRLSVGATIGTRMVAGPLAKQLAMLKKVRAAKIVGALGHAGTVVEEARAHIPGLKASLQTLREKGPRAALKTLAAPAGGLGSYLMAARNELKGLGRLAIKH